MNSDRLYAVTTELSDEIERLRGLVIENQSLRALNAELVEVLRRVDHTRLTVHGHFDSEVNLHDFIRAAIATAKGEKI